MSAGSASYCGRRSAQLHDISRAFLPSCQDSGRSLLTYMRNQSRQIMAKPYIILVHGAYHQSSHWDLLVKLLRSAGHPTSAPKLPSSSTSPLPGVFDADVSSVKQAVIDAIAEGATSIVPVFHSYGGIPGFEALASLTPQQKLTIPRVVCISAFIIAKGQSLVSVQGSSERTNDQVKVWKIRCKDCGIRP